jgi:Ser/Thr protein kinase RdoA (MazF antagonist)
MNSRVWAIRSAGGDRFVAKVMSVRSEAGLRVAQELESRGFEAGAPVHWDVVDGELVALLRFVDGEPLRPSDAALLGETLALVHNLLADAAVPETIDCWPWSTLEELEPGLIADGRLRGRVQAALAAGEGLAPAVTHGILHGDPAPCAFLRNAARVALIDWGSVLHGPLLYDSASAWMYAGPDVVSGYARGADALPAAELEQVTTFLDVRWAVQAAYFAWRIRNAVQTGIHDGSENERGLADARTALLQRYADDDGS